MNWMNGCGTEVAPSHGHRTLEEQEVLLVMWPEHHPFEIPLRLTFIRMLWMGLILFLVCLVILARSGVPQGDGTTGTNIE